MQYAGSKKFWWILSFIFSMLAVALIGYKWAEVQRIHGDETDVVRNNDDLQKVLSSRDTIEFRGSSKPYYIPTGYFIKSLAFVTPSDVNITGYLWQKYPTDLPKGYKKGIIFPEEVNSSSTEIEEISSYCGTENNQTYEMVVWYFDVTLRQSFDYSKYPLDYLTVWLRLWAKDFLNDDDIVFVPDFRAYANTGKSTRGLDQDIVPGEWEIDETFFSYKTVRYDSDFGFFTPVVEEQPYSEFFINIGIKRKFINAFVINLVPLFVVALLLFAQVMTVSGEKERMEKFGFNATGAITTCSALFFVVMLAHVQVRQLFAGSTLVYIEYFYLIMYIIILLTALNAYVFSLGKLARFNLIYYHDNFIPKVAFWPVVLWMMAIATLIVL
jgi:hypothetical protein